MLTMIRTILLTVCEDCKDNPGAYFQVHAEHCLQTKSFTDIGSLGSHTIANNYSKPIVLSSFSAHIHDLSSISTCLSCNKQIGVLLFFS